MQNKVVGNSDEYYYCSITGLYVFPHNAVEIVKRVEISERGLLEIMSLSKLFQEEKKLQIQELSNDCQWLDTNTFDNLFKCGEMVRNIVKHYKV